MPISVVCKACSAKLNAPDAAAGKKVKCPKCQGAVVVPTPDEPFVAAEIDETPRKKQPVKTAIEDDDDDRPRKKKYRDDDDDDDDRPRKKKKKGEAASGASMTRNLIGLAVLLILLGVGGAIYYYKFFKEDDPKPKVENNEPKENTPEPKQPGPNPKQPGPNPKQPPGPDPKQPGPQPGGPANKYDRSNATKAALLHGEWTIYWAAAINSLKNIRDAESVSSACQSIEKSVSNIQRVTGELKALGPIPRDAWEFITLDVNEANRLNTSYPAELKSAEQRVEKLGMPELTASFRKAVSSLEKANQEYLAAIKAVYPGNLSGTKPK